MGTCTLCSTVFIFKESCCIYHPAWFAVRIILGLTEYWLGLFESAALCRRRREGFRENWIYTHSHPLHTHTHTPTPTNTPTHTPTQPHTHPHTHPHTPTHTHTHTHTLSLSLSHCWHIRMHTVKERCCLGDRICSIPCLTCYFL